MAETPSDKPARARRKWPLPRWFTVLAATLIVIAMGIGVAVAIRDWRSILGLLAFLAVVRFLGGGLVHARHRSIVAPFVVTIAGLLVLLLIGLLFAWSGSWATNSAVLLVGRIYVLFAVPCLGTCASLGWLDYWRRKRGVQVACPVPSGRWRLSLTDLLVAIACVGQGLGAGRVAAPLRHWIAATPDGLGSRPALSLWLCVGTFGVLSLATWCAMVHVGVGPVGRPWGRALVVLLVVSAIIWGALALVALA